MTATAVPTIAIDPAFAARGVAVALGLVQAERRPSGGGDGLDEALEAAVADLRARAVEGAASVPAIAATRLAYKRCGKDPSRYRPASEALVRRVLKDDAVPRINPVVDLNNLVSLASGLALGAYDATKLAPPLTLRIGTDGDAYAGIGRGSFNVAGLPLLADSHGPFGSPTADSTRTAVGLEATSVLFVVYGFDHDVAPAMDLLAHGVSTFLGGAVTQGVVVRA